MQLNLLTFLFQMVSTHLPHSIAAYVNHLVSIIAGILLPIHTLRFPCSRLLGPDLGRALLGKNVLVRIMNVTAEIFIFTKTIDQAPRLCDTAIKSLPGTTMWSTLLVLAKALTFALPLVLLVPVYDQAG